MATSSERRARVVDLEIDEQLCLALQTTSSLITRLYRGLLNPLGLTHPQYLVLLALWERDGPLTMGEIGRRTHMETGALSPLVKRMEAAGLVSRKRDTHDERRIWVEATEAAWTLRDPVLEARREVVRRLPLSDRQISELRTALQEMSTAMDVEKA